MSNQLPGVSDINIVKGEDIYRRTMMNSGYYWKGDIEKSLKVSYLLEYNFADFTIEEKGQEGQFR